MENLSGGCHCHCCCDGGKTKSTPNLGFRLRLEFDNNGFDTIEINLVSEDYDLCFDYSLSITKQYRLYMCYGACYATSPVFTIQFPHAPLLVWGSGDRIAQLGQARLEEMIVNEEDEGTFDDDDRS